MHVVLNMQKFVKVQPKGIVFSLNKNIVKTTVLGIARGCFFMTAMDTFGSLSGS